MIFREYSEKSISIIFFLIFRKMYVILTYNFPVALYMFVHPSENS